MKRLVNFAIWLVCIFCAFYFWAHLSFVSSLLLAFFFAATLDSGREPGSAPTLLPHFVKFNPDFYQMLSDLNLVTSEIWKTAFGGEASSDPWSGDFVCRYGLYAYGLFLDAEGSTIVHWPKLGIYTEGFSASMELDNFPQTDGRPGSHSEWVPRLVIRRTSRGYGIGIEVLSSWWESVGSQLPDVHGLPFDTDHLIGRTVIYFADFPHQPLWEFSTAGVITKAVDMKVLLEKAGWTEMDFQNSETAHLHPPNWYRHKYVEIQTNFVHHIR
jgi:hypothetical protein